MTKNISIGILFLLNVFLFNTLKSQTYLYSEAFGSTGEDIGHGIASDATGNTFVTGSFEGVVNFGGGGITSGGLDDIFLVKRDVYGNHVWSKSYGGTEIQFSKAIALDPSGNIYLTGHFRTQIDFGGGNVLLQVFSDQDVFVVKLDGSGNYIWAKSFGEHNFDTGNGIAIDLNGNVLVTGNVINDVSFAGQNQVAKGGRDAFVAKYDTNGNEIWFQRFGGATADTGRGIVIDDAGNAYIAGSFTTTATFGVAVKSSNGSKDVFVASLDSLGDFRWVQTFGDTQFDIGFGIALDPDANVYVTGSFSNTVNFGGGGLTSGGSDDIFIVKMDSLGIHDWSNKYGGAGSDISYGIDADDKGNIFLTGSFSNIVDFGGGGITSGGSDDIFSIGYTTLGGFLYARGMGGIGSERGLGITVNINDEVSITGTMGSSTNFGGGIKTNAGGSDMFLYTSNHSLILPISFADFHAEVDKQEVALAWAINSEIPYRGFAVERAKGSGEFQKLESSISPQLSSQSQLLSFSCLDQKVMPGRYYYRIKSEDLDGHYSYSKTIQVHVKMTPSGVLDVSYEAENKSISLHIVQEEHITGEIQLLNFQGQILRTFGVRGGDHLTIDLSTLPASSYVLKYKGAKYQGVLKIWRY